MDMFIMHLDIYYITIIFLPFQTNDCSIERTRLPIIKCIFTTAGEGRRLLLWQAALVCSWQHFTRSELSIFLCSIWRKIIIYPEGKDEKKWAKNLQLQNLVSVLKSVSLDTRYIYIYIYELQRRTITKCTIRIPTHSGTILTLFCDHAFFQYKYIKQYKITTIAPTILQSTVIKLLIQYDT